MKDKDKTVYFIENLTIVSWFLKILPYLSRTGNIPIKSVYYFDCTRSGRLAAKLTGGLVKIDVKRLEFKLLDIRDENGKFLGSRVAHEDLATVQGKTADSSIFKDILGLNEIKGRLPFYLAKKVGDGDYTLTYTLFRTLLLVQIVSLWTRREFEGNVQPLLFMNKRVWSREISEYARDLGVIIADFKHFDFRLKDILNRPHIKYYVKALYNYKTFFRIKDARLAKDRYAEPKIYVQSYGQFNFDFPEMNSDLFFWQQSKISGRNILLSFGLERDPVDDSKMTKMNENNMSAVVVSPRALKTRSIDLFNYKGPIKKFKFNPNSAKSDPRPVERIWLEKQVSRYCESFDYWRELFKRYNARIYLTWYKYDADHCFIADAIQSLEGVSVVYQRSIEEFPSLGVRVSMDIMFAFSKSGADIERKSLSRIPYYIVTGYLGDYRFVHCRPHSEKIREKLLSSGARRIISYFDENTHDDSRWSKGHEFMRQDYFFLLKKVLENDWLGIVFKPKVPFSLRRRLGPVAEMLKKAEETGRCYVFEGGGALQGVYPPAIAALGSDIAIHGEPIAATAAVEAALAGVPALLMDREGILNSRICDVLGKGRVVFSEWEHLWEGCIAHWNTKNSIPGFADWTPMLDELDPFRDGKAAERMGTYLGWIIDGFKRGASRQDVLSEAAEKYSKIWGADKILAVN